MKVAWVMVVTALAALVACSRMARPNLESNVAELTIANREIRTTKTDKPYTGKLVARDAEIVTVARALLDDVAFARVAEADPNGLVLVLPVAKGVPEGKATVYVDLRSPTLGNEVTRFGDATAIALARTVVPAIEIAEASFVAGKLDGTAIAYAPTSDGRGTAKIGQVQLRDNTVHGDAIEYYAGGSAKRRHFRFDRGVQAGVQEWFHTNGKVERTSTYVAGKPHGEALASYANGAKRARATYEHGVLTGTFEEWFPDGTRAREVVHDASGGEVVRAWYSNGKPAIDETGQHPPDGAVEEFHPNGQVRTRTTYVAGVKQGPFAAFYADGAKWKAGELANGTPTGIYQEWWKTGKLAVDSRYVDGALDGAYRRFYANGTPWETAEYVAGKRNGPYRKWWKNGKPAHVYAYKLGKLDGDYRMFYDTGAKWAVGSYADGKPQGTLQRWFPDGTLGYVMHHENGRPHGDFKRWYAGGKPRLVATYVRGQLDGSYENWNEDGSVFERATYQGGTQLSSTRAPLP